MRKSLDDQQLAHAVPFLIISYFVLVQRTFRQASRFLRQLSALKKDS